jgi:CRP/FNR family cyclic AMP-dependent transcriptional regulator
MSLMFDLFRHEPTFVDVAAGNYLFREGDASKELMYVLIAGKANIQVGDRLVEEAGAGTIVGEMGITHPNEQRSASILALTDCRFAELNTKRFKYLVSEAPYFAIEVMQVLADRLRRADALLSKHETPHT